MILTAPATAETKVKNSRFVAEVSYVDTPEEARDLWRYRKNTYDNGGHIVYAFAVGRRQNICGCSDDGEPSGTAGKPVLAVLKGSGITNVLLTVTRYFGGIKLGTGGLVHAYSDAAKAVIAVAAVKELADMATVEIEIVYNLHGTLLNRIAALGFVVEKEEFAAKVRITGSLFAGNLPELKLLLDNTGNGKIIWRQL